MTLVRFHPNHAVSCFDQDFSNLIRSLWDRSTVSPESPGGFLPALDVHETKDSYHVTVDLPGLTQEEVKVTVVDNSLVIRGEKKTEVQEESANYHRVERSYGHFERILQLVNQVDKNRVTASMKDGVLRIAIPKAEEARERAIDIQVK